MLRIQIQLTENLLLKHQEPKSSLFIANWATILILINVSPVGK